MIDNDTFTHGIQYTVVIIIKMNYYNLNRKFNVLLFLLLNFSVSTCTGGPRVLNIGELKKHEAHDQASSEIISTGTIILQTTKAHESVKSDQNIHTSGQLSENKDSTLVETAGDNSETHNNHGKLEYTTDSKNSSTGGKQSYEHQVDGNIHFVEKTDNKVSNKDNTAQNNNTLDKHVHSIEPERHIQSGDQILEKDTHDKIKQVTILQHKPKKPAHTTGGPTNKATYSSDRSTNIQFETKISTNTQKIHEQKMDIEIQTPSNKALPTSVTVGEPIVRHSDVGKDIGDGGKSTLNKGTKLNKTENIVKGASSSMDKSTASLSHRTAVSVIVTDDSENNDQTTRRISSDLSRKDNINVYASNISVYPKEQTTTHAAPSLTLQTTIQKTRAQAKEPTHQLPNSDNAGNVPVEGRPKSQDHQSICHSGYSSEAVISGIIGGFILGCGLMIVCFYGKTRCNKYIRGDYRRVPLEYDFELNPRYKTR